MKSSTATCIIPGLVYVAACAATHPLSTDDVTPSGTRDLVVTITLDSGSVSGATWLVDGKGFESRSMFVREISGHDHGQRVRMCAESGVTWAHVFDLFVELQRVGFLKVILPGDWSMRPYQIGLQEQGAAATELGIRVPAYRFRPGSQPSEARNLLLVAIDKGSAAIRFPNGVWDRVGQDGIRASLKQVGDSNEVRCVVLADTEVEWVKLQHALRELVAAGFPSFDFGCRQGGQDQQD
jgi:hypothetical protein